MTGVWFFAKVLGLIFVITLIIFIVVVWKKRSTARTQPAGVPQTPQPATAGTTAHASQTNSKSGFKPYWEFAKKVAIFCVVCYFGWMGSILLLQQAELFKQTGGPEYHLDPTKTTAPGERSAFYDGRKTIFLNEVIQFCYFDKELGLTREEAWDCVDMVKAESRFRMYNEDGSVFRGEQNPDDTGIFMINTQYQAKNIAKAGCNLDSFECQKKVFRLIFLEKRSFEPWTAYSGMKKLPVNTFQVSAPVEDWSGEFYLPRNGSCLVIPSKEMQMLGGNGTPVTVSPDHVPFMDSPFIRFKSQDERVGMVTIKCRA
jgi:hypothetical protein